MKYYIIDYKNGDRFETCIEEKNNLEAIKTLKREFSSFPKSDQKKRSSFYLSLDENGESEVYRLK